MTKGLALVATKSTAFLLVGFVSVIALFGATTQSAYAASCSVAKTNSTVNTNIQVEGIVSNASARPNTVELGGVAMLRTAGPFDTGGGIWETTYESYLTLTKGVTYSLWVNYSSGRCEGSHYLGGVKAV